MLLLTFMTLLVFFGAIQPLSAAEAIGTEHIASGLSHLPPLWTVTPFAMLLMLIATGPLLFHRFWEHHYPKIAIGLGSLVALFYLFYMEHGSYTLLHTVEEYLSFIALLSALFIVSGGILIKIDRQGTPAINASLLFFGALIANVIGTTGASMLLIRPYMRINKGRLKPFHILFFIFIVSNIGGGLTPIGDPPLFLGFLKGVPFFWVLPKVWLPWLVTVLGLLLLFFVIDSRVKSKSIAKVEKQGGVSIKGSKNFIFLAVIIAAVFLDPTIIDGVPSLKELFHLPFGIREVIFFVVAVISYKTADREALKGNEFNFEPIKEVAFLFVGIFFTMIPALALIGSYAASQAEAFSVSRFYWLTGILSGVLDNAPTYLNFLAAAAGKFGVDMGSPADIQRFADGIASPITGDVSSDIYLMAISIASVFFGAMTYIGNAPNFMVKNIAAQADVDMPDFLQYIYKYSLPILLPFYIVLWLLFFNC